MNYENNISPKALFVQIAMNTTGIRSFNCANSIFSRPIKVHKQMAYTVCLSSWATLIQRNISETWYCNSLWNMTIFYDSYVIAPFSEKIFSNVSKTCAIRTKRIKEPNKTKKRRIFFAECTTGVAIHYNSIVTNSGRKIVLFQLFEIFFLNLNKIKNWKKK